ncbi:MAG: O-antigen ligase family protein [Verrucomicrobia bacterium]|nr:O-antigen ligase family protein [Verrucomicrobiota bacterium]
MVFLGIQAWNSGRIRVFDFDTGRWGYSPPPHPGLPWAFTEEDGMEMIRWFAPVFTVFLIYKHARPLSESPKTVGFFLGNCMLVAILALIHQFAGWTRMYDFWGMGEVWGIARNSGRDTFGSFGYPNNAATYFILVFSYTLGLFLRELLRDRSERRPVVLTVYATLALLFFFTAQFSVSRTGMLGVWIVLILNLGVLAVIGWPRAHPVQRFYAVFGILLTLTALIAGFRMFAQPAHLREFAAATTKLDPGREFTARFFQVESAWAIWKDHPWFGTGGWGYKYLVGYYLDPEYWGLLSRGKANVHNDFFQFLCEFGLVGMSLLGLVFVPSMFKLLRDCRLCPHHDQSVWADPVRFSLGCGLLLMVAHSMIDLPFRSPAVFAHGALFLLMAQQTHGTRAVWSERVDWRALQPAVRLKNTPP